MLSYANTGKHRHIHTNAGSPQLCTEFTAHSHIRIQQTPNGLPSWATPHHGSHNGHTSTHQRTTRYPRHCRSRDGSGRAPTAHHSRGSRTCRLTAAAPSARMAPAQRHSGYATTRTPPARCRLSCACAHAPRQHSRPRRLGCTHCPGNFGGNRSRTSRYPISPMGLSRRVHNPGTTARSSSQTSRGARQTTTLPTHQIRTHMPHRPRHH